MAAPHPPATSHLISSRAARDAAFRDVLSMVMEGRAPPDYVEGFWAEVEKMRLDEAERQVRVLAERNEAERRREERRRKMRESGVGVYPSLGEWFEDWKGGKTSVEGRDEEMVTLDLRRTERRTGEGGKEENDDEGEEGEGIDAVYKLRRRERRRSDARVGVVRRSIGATGSSRRRKDRRAATIKDEQRHSLFGPYYYASDDEADDVTADGEELQDSSEDEGEPEEDGDTTMLDVELGGSAG